MKTHKELIDASKAALAQAESISAKAEAEDRDLTDDEVAEIEQHAEESNQFIAEAESLKRRESAVASIGSIKDKLKQPEAKRIASDAIGVGTAVLGAVRERDPMLAAIARHGRNLKCFKDEPENAYAMGQWFRALVNGNLNAQEWCLNNGFEYRAAMTSGAGSGGSLVPEELSSRIISLVNDYGVFAREAFNQPMSSETMIVPRRTGGITSYPIGENQEPTESNVTFDHIELIARLWGTESKIPNSLMEDAIISLGDWVANEIARANSFAQDDSGFNGDGTSTYHGISGIRTNLISSASNVGYVNAVSGNDQFGEIDSIDFDTMMATLPEYVYRMGNPKWYCSRTCWSLDMQRLAMASGGVTAAEYVNGMPSFNFKGFPVVITPVMPSVTTALNNVVMVLFGDLSLSSTFGMRRQLGVRVLNERYAEFDQTGIVSFTRWTINNHDYGDTSVAGPIVGLIGNT